MHSIGQTKTIIIATLWNYDQIISFTYLLTSEKAGTCRSVISLDYARVVVRYIRPSVFTGRHSGHTRALFIATSIVSHAYYSHLTPELGRNRFHKIWFRFHATMYNWLRYRQETQLSQRGRAMLRIIEYVAKSLRITDGHWLGHHSKAWVRLPIRIS